MAGKFILEPFSICDFQLLSTCPGLKSRVKVGGPVTSDLLSGFFLGLSSVMSQGEIFTLISFSIHSYLKRQLLV